MKTLIGWLLILLGIGAFMKGYGFIVFLIVIAAIWLSMLGAGKKPPRDSERN